MKIAEALKRIHSLKGRLRSVWEMAEQNSYYMEGKPRPEMDLGELLDEAGQLTLELRDLKNRTQKRNHEVRIGEESLAEVIVRLGDLRSEISLRTKVLNAMPKGTKDKYWGDDSVVIYKPAIPEKEQRVKIEELSRQIEMLDIEIQKVNWSTDL